MHKEVQGVPIFVAGVSLGGPVVAKVARLVRPQSEQAVREALEKIDTKAYRDADQAGTGGSKDP